MSFFQSILPSIANLTEDQKLEFRGEVLNIIIKRLRSAPQQNYGQQPNIQYNVPAYPTTCELLNYSSQPTTHQQYYNSTQILPNHNFFNYMHGPQFQRSSLRYSQPRPSSAAFLQSHIDSRQHFNPI